MEPLLTRVTREFYGMLSCVGVVGSPRKLPRISDASTGPLHPNVLCNLKKFGAGIFLIGLG